MASQGWRSDLKSLASYNLIDRMVYYRNMLRDAQKSMAATEEEVAVSDDLAFCPVLEDSSKVEVNDPPTAWTQAKVRAQCYSSVQTAVC